MRFSGKECFNFANKKNKIFADFNCQKNWYLVGICLAISDSIQLTSNCHFHQFLPIFSIFYPFAFLVRYEFQEIAVDRSIQQIACLADDGKCGNWVSPSFSSRREWSELMIKGLSEDIYSLWPPSVLFPGNAIRCLDNLPQAGESFQNRMHPCHYD